MKTHAEFHAELEDAILRHRELLDALRRERKEREAEEQAIERRAALEVLPGGQT